MLPTHYPYNNLWICSSFFCELYASSPGHEILCCMHYMIRFAPFVHSASCTHIQSMHFYTPTVRPSQPAGPHTLANLGGGASEYTVVVWPRAVAWLFSSGQSVSPSFCKPVHTTFLLPSAKQQLNKHIYVKQVCINDFMLERLKEDCSDI